MKDITEFFHLENNAYKCLVADCKSKIYTLRKWNLIRHFECKHPSKLVEVKSLKHSNLEQLKQETIYLCVAHVAVDGRTLNSIGGFAFKKLLMDRLNKLHGTPQQITYTEISKNL